MYNLVVLKYINNVQSLIRKPQLLWSPIQVKCVIYI